MENSSLNLEVKRLGAEDILQSHSNCLCFWNMKGGEDNLREFLADPKCVLVAAEVDGEPAGQIIGHILRRWDAKQPAMFLYSIDVLEKYRQKGIGRTLIRELNRIAVEAGCRETFVLTDKSNTPATSLYQSAGAAKVYPDEVMFVWNLK